MELFTELKQSNYGSDSTRILNLVKGEIIMHNVVNFAGKEVIMCDAANLVRRSQSYPTTNQHQKHCC